MSRSKKWNDKHSKLVLDCMCDGMQPAEIFRVHKAELPSYKTFEREQVSNPAFKAEVDAAYTVIYFKQIQELEELSLMTVDECLAKYGKIVPESPKAFAASAEFKKSRIDALKFSLAKLAAILSPRFAAKQVVEHSGAVQQQFVIANYSAPLLAEPKIIDNKEE